MFLVIVEINKQYCNKNKRWKHEEKKPFVGEMTLTDEKLLYEPTQSPTYIDFIIDMIKKCQKVDYHIIKKTYKGEGVHVLLNGKKMFYNNFFPKEWIFIMQIEVYLAALNLTLHN